jgi:hypothetical protein
MDNEILNLLKSAITAKELELTMHAAKEVYEESITPEEILQSLANGQILENYPDHRRGACCLVYGSTNTGRSLHVVCTTARKPVLIITVYEPRLPKWIAPTQRSSG